MLVTKFFVRGCLFLWWPLYFVGISHALDTVKDLNNLVTALTVIAHDVENRVPQRDLTAQEEAEDIARDLATLETSQGIELSSEIRLPAGRTLKVVIPLLGEILLKAERDKTGNQIFTAQYPRTDKPFQFGDLVIKEGRMQLGNGKLSWIATVELFGKKGRIGLKEFSINTKKSAEKSANDSDKELEFYKVVFGVTFDNQAARLELIPGKSVELQHIDIIFEQNKSLELRASADIFGQKSYLAAEYDTINKKFSIKGEIERRELTKVLPELKGTPLDQLYIEGSLLFNLSDGLIIKGVLASSESDAITVNGVTLQKAFIEISSKKGQAFIMGESDVLGLQLKGYCAIALGKQPRLQFKVEVPLTKDWEPFKDSTSEELRAIKIGSLHLVTEGGYNALINGVSSYEEEKQKLQKIPKSPTGSTLPTSFEEVFASGVEVRKGLQFSLFIAGESVILNTPSELIAKIFATQNGFGVTMVAGLPKGWKLSTSIPEFKPDPALICKDFFKCLESCSQDLGKCAELATNYIKSAIDLIQLEHARFVISSRDDVINDQRIEKGFNILAKISLGGTYDNIILQALQDVVHKVGQENASLAFAGAFNPAAPRSAFFKVGISNGGFGFKLGPAMVYGGALNMVIRGEPSMGLETMVKVKPTATDEPIELAVNAAFTPIKFEISGSALNTWKNALGIPNLEIGNIGLRGSQTYTALAEAAGAAAATFGVGSLWIFVPADFGFAGCVRFGNPQGKNFMANARVNIGKDISSLAVVADICEPLTLPYFFDVLVQQFGLDVSLTKIIDTLMPVQLKKAGIRVVPIGATIGNVRIEQGIGGYYYIDLFGKEAHCDFSIGLGGITAKGAIPAFEIGPLKMTNSDDSCPTITPLNALETKAAAHERPPVCWCNEKDRDNFVAQDDRPPHTCGPLIDIQLNAHEQKFVIDGLMKIGDLIQSKTKWYLTKDGMAFDTETFIGHPDNKLGVRIKGTTLKFDVLELLKVSPEDIMLEIEFKDDLSERLREDIAKELERVQIDFEREVNTALEQLGRDTMIHDIREQERSVRAAQENRVWFLQNPPLSVQRELEVKRQELKLLALQAKYYFENTEVGKFLTQTARKIGFDKLAQTVLSGFKGVGVGLLKHGRLVFDDISKLVIVKRIYWKGTLADLAKTKLPGVEIVLCAGCQEFKRTLPSFDILDPFTSTGKLAHELFGTIKDVVVATFKGGQCKGACGEKTKAVPLEQQTRSV